MKAKNTTDGKRPSLSEKEREYHAGYFQGFAAAHKQGISMVKDYFFSNIRLLVREGKSTEEILCYLGDGR